MDLKYILNESPGPRIRGHVSNDLSEARNGSSPDGNPPKQFTVTHSPSAILYAGQVSHSGFNTSTSGPRIQSALVTSASRFNNVKFNVSSEIPDDYPLRIEVDSDGKKRYECPICYRKFIAKGHCNIHIRTVHFKLKDGVCLMCNKKFPQKGSCKRHVQSVHLKKKPFTCPEPKCTSSFSQKWGAKNHYETVHLKIKDHACRVAGCADKFAEKWNRKKHEITVHRKSFDDSAWPPPQSSGRDGSMRRKDIFAHNYDST